MEVLIIRFGYKNKGLVSYVDSNRLPNMNGSFAEFNFAPVSSAQFIRFDSDGHEGL